MSALYRHSVENAWHVFLSGIELTAPELQPLRSAQLYTSLREELRSDQQSFNDWVQQLVAQGDIDVDFVYPHPVNKTLLEAACCEGLVESVRLLIKLGANVNRLNHAHNRAPIHFAAEAGQADVLRALLQEERCNPDLQIEKQTALHIAVGNDFTDCVRVLLEYGANPNIANSEGLTPIHIAARKRNREIVQLILNISKILPNLDDFHDHKVVSRSRRVQLTTRQILQKEFPDLELPTAGESEIDIEELRHSLSNGNESDFLENLRRISDDRLTDVDSLIEIAAKYNFSDAMCELLKKGRRFKSVEETSRIAVRFGLHTVLRDMLTLDAKLGNKLLLQACRVLRKTDCRANDRMKCFRLILDQPNINVQCEDDTGNIPLHYAARAGSMEAVYDLLRLGCSLGHRNILGEPPLALMSPGVLSDLFDNCICIDNGDIHPDNWALDLKMEKCKILFNYHYLIPRLTPTSEENIPVSTSVYSEMEALACIAENPALQPLLKHPLLSSFLDLKWRRIRYGLLANFVFYVIFYTLINAYILSTNHPIDSSSATSPNSSNLTSAILHTNFQQLNGLGTLTAMFLVLLVVRETFQLISSPGHYLTNTENIFELVLIVLSVWTLVAPNPQIGAIVILVSAWELVLLMGQHPSMSTGIVMLKIVTLNFLQSLFLYATLILAFALAFSMLFSNTKDNENFLDLRHSLFKTVIMLTGEFDSNDIPFGSHPVLSRCIFVLFVLLIAIVMLNLLNGLAVSDTADILKKSEIVALISRVKVISYFEGVAVGLGLIKIVVGRCYSESAIRRSMFKSPGFFGMRTLLYPEYLPMKKISVKPYESNKIMVHGPCGTCPDRKTWNLRRASVWETFRASFYESWRSCIDWSMDALTVHQAIEILSRRKASMSAEMENRKMIAEFDTMKAKLERIETAINGLSNVTKSL